MNQSSFIAGALLAGFVLYVAAKGRLTVYTSVLWGPTNAALPPFLGIPLLQTPTTSPTSPSATSPKSPSQGPNPLDSLPKIGEDLGKAMIEGAEALGQSLIEGAGELVLLA